MVWSRLVRLALLFLPALLVGWGGASYLRSIFETLQAPNAPFAYRHETPAGPVDILGDSYAYQNGKLDAQGLRVLTPEGELLRVGRARIDVQKLIASGGKHFDGEFSRVYADIRRQKSGKFNFEKYLPEPTDVVEENPVRVVVRNADVSLRDEMGTEPFTLRARTPRVTFEGLGESFLAGGRVVTSEGSTSISVRQVAKRSLIIEGTTDGLRLDRILRHLQTTPETQGQDALRETGLTALSTAGRYSVRIPLEEGSERGVLFRLDGEASASGLAYQDWRADSVVAKGTVTQAGFAGVADAEEGANQAKFQGNANWADQNALLAGQVEVGSPSNQGLPAPIRSLLPREARFQAGRFAGWVALAGEDYRVRGTVNARQATWQTYRADAISTEIDIDPANVVARAEGRYEGLPVAANLGYDLKENRVLATLPPTNLTVRQIRALLPNLRESLEGVEGTVQVAGVVNGPVDRPLIRFRGKGGGLVTAGGERIDVRELDFRAFFDNKRLAVQRVYANTTVGTAALIANANPETQRLEGRLLATGQLQNLAPDLVGAASLVANLSGTLADPKLDGRIYAYDVGNKDVIVPFAQSNVSASLQSAELSDIKAGKSTAALTGSASVRFANGAIRGTFQLPGIVPQDWIATDAIRGLIDLDEVRIGGTLREPLVAVEASGDRLVAQDLLLRNLRLRARLDGDVVTLQSFDTTIGEGAVTASGSFDLKQESVSGLLEFKDVVAQRLNPVTSLPLDLTGMLEGRVEITGPARNPQIRADGRALEVTVDQTPFGSGFWLLEGTPEELRGEAEIGSLERYLRVENLVARPSQESVEGTVVAFRNQLSDYISAARRNTRELSYEAQRVLGGLTGSLDAEATFRFERGELDIDAPAFLLSDVKIGEDEIADADLKFARSNRQWTIERFRVTGPAVDATITGSLDERGPIDVDGEIVGFQLALLSRYAPNIPPLEGRADLSFVATGSSRNPDVTASLFATQALRTSTQGDLQQNIVLQLAPIEIRPNDLSLGDSLARADVQGSVQYKNLTVNLTSLIPLDWRVGIQPDAPIQGKLEIRSDLVKVDEASEIGLFDPSRTRGELAGTLEVSGTSEDLRIQGTVVLDEADVAIRGITTSLRNVTVNADFQRQSWIVTSQATSSKGGTIQGRLQASPPTLERILADLRDGIPDELLATELTGQIDLAAFRVDEDGLPFGEVASTLNGTLAISGPASSPLIAGEVNASSSRMGFVFQPVEAGAPFVPPIDPRFNVRFATRSPFRFETTGADLRLSGGGTLTGSLTAPTVEASLALTEGSLRLPNARVRLEPGGSVRPLFRLGNQPDAISQVLLEVEGRTSITATRFANQPERFDILLGVRGDLIREGALNFTATSEPGGLSQERILATIGTGDLLDSLSGGLERSNQFGQALLNVAIPVFLSGFTDQVARGLGLDYIGLTFDDRQVATINFYETLGLGFFLDGYRQFGDRDEYGRLAAFELRIGYRLPTSRRGLDRYRLVLGTDHIRPWKFGIDYSTRYGNVPSLETSRLRVISGNPGSVPPRDPPKQ